MLFPQKIMLENSIFARADRVCAVVHARAGRLISSSKDACLQTLLQVYNTFFCKENWKNFCMEENPLEGLYSFNNHLLCAPVFSTKDYKFELIMGEKNAQ